LVNEKRMPDPATLPPTRPPAESTRAPVLPSGTGRSTSSVEAGPVGVASNWNRTVSSGLAKPAVCEVAVIRSATPWATMSRVEVTRGIVAPLSSNTARIVSFV
jgi:hypothetical protein